MARMDQTTLRAMLAAQKSDALASQHSDKLSHQRSNAMDYYLGDMRQHMPAEEGCSSAISTDVSDTIEGLMPNLMEMFCGGEDVVSFKPVSAEDVAAAEQETDYITHIFLQKNPGFQVLYSFIKDALLQKFGVVKAWWETSEQKTTETYLDQTQDQFENIILQVTNSNGALEITEQALKESVVIDQATGQETKTVTFDVTLQTTHKYEQAKVMGVPPEEFGIERNARSIATSNYCFHKIVTLTEAALVEQGYDEAQVRALPTYGSATNTEEMSRDSVSESYWANGEANPATRVVEIFEHYVRMDYEGKGETCLYKVTTGGQDEVLTKGGKPDIEEMDAMPFAAMTPIIIPHRFVGRSVADLVMEIQKIKTALIRSMLDAQYLANRPRSIVYEENASESTIDDLLVARPNGVIRAKKPGAVEVFKTPGVSGEVIPLMEYMDSTREYRSGVSRQGQGIDAESLQNVSATASMQAYNASQARLKMIARIFAETGIRDLFLLLHSIVRKHATQVDTVQLRKQWVPVNPRGWRTRTDMTCLVGLGDGGRQQKAANITMMLGLQEKAASARMPIVAPKNFYNSVKSLCETMGLKDVENYWIDPDSPEGQLLQQQIASQPDPKTQQAQAKLALETQKTNGKAELERIQAASDIAANTHKINAEMLQSEQEASLKKDLMLIQAELDRRKDMRAEQQHNQNMVHKELNHQAGLVPHVSATGLGII